LNYLSNSVGNELLFTTLDLVSVIVTARLGLLPAFQHASSVYPDQRKGTVIFVSIMA
jgi:hypothetical protein